ncbi:hypothetical protein [Paenibacillus sedimenti]|uniref:Uncharacterized protein n=1 Tax=Paenibacillus sedimenti TaxID=2770274 RepID=A0A926QLK2_9BACL|nr:hypothetical protein [Paenibacillus sedimenti]MBD0383996.1 hypothetical protein [Paenibacillus sedimenti]
MNQRIQAEHVHQLDHDQKEILRSQWTPQEGEYILFADQEEMIYYLAGVEKHKSLPLLSVGQMIAYISGRDASFKMHFDSGVWQVSVSGCRYKDAELCDVLWEAMKRILSHAVQ